MQAAQISWCAQRFDHLNACLTKQGFTPDLIDYLNQKKPRFKRKFDHCLQKIDELARKISQDPHAYHWAEDIDQTIHTFLTFTNGNRREFLFGDPPDLAQTA